MKNSKLITFVLVLLVCFSLVLTVSATSDKNLTLAVEANPSTVVYGNTIKVSVKANENPGFLCVNFQIMWDTSVLEFVSADTTGSSFTEVEANHQEKFNRVVITVGDPYIALNKPEMATKFKGTGKIVDLTFKVKEGADADNKAVIKFVNPSFVGLDGVSSETMTTKDLTVNVLSSSHVHKSAKPATCTKPELCELCGAQMAPAKGHNPKTVPAKNPTCTETGLSSGSKCADCGATLKKQTVVAATGHNMVNGVCAVCGIGCAHTGGTATCTKQAVCTICGQSYGELSAHTPGAAATCTSEQKCTICQAVIADKAAHAIEKVDAKDATCGAIGWAAYEKCKNCSYTTYKEIAATGAHTFGKWVVVKKATLNATGEKTHVCTVCNFAESAVIPQQEFPVVLVIAAVVVLAAVVILIIVIKKKKK